MVDEAYITVRNVTKRFKKEAVISDVSLEMTRGKIYGFVGENGSGKSVFFKLIAGIYRTDIGAIYVNGIQIGKDRDFPLSMGLMIEHTGFLKQYSGYDNLSYLANIRKWVTGERIKTVMRQVGLEPDDSKKVGKYSLGMKQRLGIAQAIMEEPELLILDEPMNGLDQKNISVVRDILMELREENKTILLSSHNKEDIDLLCDSVYMVKNGKILGA